MKLLAGNSKICCVCYVWRQNFTLKTLKDFCISYKQFLSKHIRYSILTDKT